MKVQSESEAAHSCLTPTGLQTTRLLRPWDLQARVLEWGAIAFSENSYLRHSKTSFIHIYIYVNIILISVLLPSFMMGSVSCSLVSNSLQPHGL